MRKRKRMHVYEKPWHAVVTLLFIVAPFVFLLIFSQTFHIPTDQLFERLFVSLARIFVAYVISAVIGWVCAVSLYRGKRAVIALPIFDILQSMPTYAALPLAVVFLGATNFTVIVFLVLAIIWPIFFSIVGALKVSRHDWEEAVEIMDLKGFDYLRYYLWPMSVNGLLTGSLIGMGNGWEALVATEIIVGIKSGLGQFFNQYNTNATITIFGILGLLFIIFSINRLVWTPLLERSHRLLEE